MASPKVFLQFPSDTILRGVAIDVCRRKIYYTNSNLTNPSIGRASLDGSNQEILISNKGHDKILFMPIGIAVDQFSERIYWVDNLEGNHFAVESAALDGTDRRTLVKDIENSPHGITVDMDNVYWTDQTYQAVWKIPKNATVADRPEIVQNISTIPWGIISKNHLLSTQSTNPACELVVNKVKEEILHGSSTDKPSAAAQKPQDYCLNTGELIPNTTTCICPKDFKGARCDIPVCHNYCIQGVCSVTTTGYAKCKCEAGFTGERCEVNLCQGFCLNGGSCVFEESEPVCHCASSFNGRHCEIMNTEKLCEVYCENGKNDVADRDLSQICGK